MINLEKRKLLFGAAGVFAGAALVTTGVKAVSVSSPISTQDQDSREQMRLKHLPNVPLLTHNNEEVRFYDDLIKLLSTTRKKKS